MCRRILRRIWIDEFFIVLLFMLWLCVCGEDGKVSKHSGEGKMDLLAPTEVLVDEISSDSLKISWKAPVVPSEQTLKLFTYTLVITPVAIRYYNQEKEFSLAPSIRQKTVTGLKEGAQYVVQLSAVYGDPNQKIHRNNLVVAAAPKFIISTSNGLQRDVPVDDGDDFPAGEPPCNCSEPGMIACSWRPGFVDCTCQPGYTGQWCEDCAIGNFRDGKECKVCPCSNLTSTTQCTIDSSHKVRCVECLPGHRGGLCTSCTSGYHWVDDRCMPLDCLSSSEGCIFIENRFPSPAQRSNSDRSIADGTLPLIAVVVTLGILLLVAAMATCYRYWTYKQHQPRIPFWSIELQDDKSDLQGHCQYQHLDAATNRTVCTSQPEGITSSSFGRSEGGRLTTELHPRTYNTMNA